MERVKLHEAGIDLWRVDITRPLAGAVFFGASFMFQRRSVTMGGCHPSFIIYNEADDVIMQVCNWATLADALCETGLPVSYVSRELLSLNPLASME